MKNRKQPENIRLFRYFRLFRNLFLPSYIASITPLASWDWRMEETTRLLPGGFSR